MVRGRGHRVAVLAVFAAVLALPAPAGAVLSGENGRIVFTSGRGEASDATARLYLRPVPFSTGGGTTSPTITPGAGLGQHRHPTWSPDRTMVAYARGDNNCGATTTNCAIYVLDLTDPNATPQPITGVDNVADDRPAWSPDGTMIAYESEVVNGSGQTDILVDTNPLQVGEILNITGASAAVDWKPAWSPDSQTVYYATDVDPGAPVDNDIVSEPPGGGTVTPIITGTTDDYQASLSPNGQQLCFTRGTFGSNDAEVYTANSNGTGVTLFSFDDNVGSYNCTWSPDGTLIAYVDGIFSTGDLVIQGQASGSGGFPLPIESTAARFDGNPDWAPDGRPSCEDATVTTNFNTPVSIPVTCPDTGPEYEQSQVNGIIDTGVANGTTSPSDDDPAFPFPANVTYTPNQGFAGTDTFTTLAFDEFGFADRQGTITINVRAARTITFDATKAKKKKQGATASLAVKKGKKAQFSGDVTASGNVAGCESNQTVELQRKKPSQATFTTFDELQTDAAGNFSVKKKIKKTFEWRAVLGENQACEDATSESEKVKAKKKKK